MIKSSLKWLMIVVVTAVVSGYIGYLYAGYEAAFYCEKLKTPTIAL